jgi:hypothetical protein
MKTEFANYLRRVADWIDPPEPGYVIFPDQPEPNKRSKRTAPQKSERVWTPGDTPKRSHHKKKPGPKTSGRL